MRQLRMGKFNNNKVEVTGENTCDFLFPLHRSVLRLRLCCWYFNHFQPSVQNIACPVQPP